MQDIMVAQGNETAVESTTFDMADDMVAKSSMQRVLSIPGEMHNR